MPTTRRSTRSLAACAAIALALAAPPARAHGAGDVTRWDRSARGGSRGRGQWRRDAG